MPISAGQNGVASDFINESEKNATPANDEGRVPKLEDDGKISDVFLNLSGSFGVSRVVSSGGGITYTDELFRQGNVATGQYNVVTENSGGILNDIDTKTSTWTDADVAEGGWVVKDSFLYGMLEDNGTSPDTFRVYRYPISSITDAGTLMTFAGAKVLVQSDNLIKMTSDGTNFYFSYDAGNSANQYVIAKYTLLGTTLTYVSSITLSDSGAFNGGFIVNETSGDIFTLNSSIIKRYNSSGVLQETSATFAGVSTLLNYLQTNYMGEPDGNVYNKLL